MDEQALQKLIGAAPREDQQKVLDALDEHNEVLLACGTRYGKSFLAAYVAIREFVRSERRILEWSKTKEGPKPKPVKIWVIAPTYGLTDKVMAYIVPFFYSVFPEAKNAVKTRPSIKITGKYGSVIEGKTGEKSSRESLLGDEIDIAILDECAQMDEGVPHEMRNRLMTRKGKSIYISTPFGFNWYYYKKIELEDKGLESCVFTFPSSVNPLNDPEWIEETRKLIPEKKFKQDFLASFEPDASSVFGDVTGIVGDTLREPERGAFYIVGVDVARKVDFTVITVIDRATREVVYFDRFNQIEWPLQKAKIAAIAKHYNNARVILDENNVGDPLALELEMEGVVVDRFNFNRKTKNELIEKLIAEIEQKRIKIPDNPILIGELHTFGYTMTEAGNVTMSGPPGGHDDCVISLALAAWGLAPGEPKKRKSPMNSFIEDTGTKRRKTKTLI